MNPIPKWANHFGINQATWDDLCREAKQRDVLPLEIAFGRGLIDENALLEWESKESGLHIVEVTLFDENPPFNHWKGQEYKKCRAALCMPVTQWGNHVYWAKASGAPTGLEKEITDVKWMLAPISGLIKWFDVWKDQVNAAFQPARILKDDDEVPDAEENYPIDLTSHVPGLRKPGEAGDESSGQSTSGEEEPTLPAGLKEDPAVINNIDFSSIRLDPAPKEEPKKPDPKKKPA